MLPAPAMFPHITSVDAGEWRPGPYPGVELLELHTNPNTGGSTVLRKFHAGTTVPAHLHPETNESVYIQGPAARPTLRPHGSREPHHLRRSADGEAGRRKLKVINNTDRHCGREVERRDGEPGLQVGPVPQPGAATRAGDDESSR
jgi:hypothetical protein